jgi:hydroxymethylglutaryl-CoA reductase (NADPH)
MLIPTMLLKRLYTFGSLENTPEGVTFAVKNRLSDVVLTGLSHIKIDGHEIPFPALVLDLGNGDTRTPEEITDKHPLDFPLRKIVKITAHIPHLPLGKHNLELSFRTKGFGKLHFDVEDAISENHEHLVRIPRDPENDYSPEIIRARQKFVEEYTGAKLDHMTRFSFDPDKTRGNIENLTGVAQIPIGFAGPLTIHGEHAQGEFLIPLATTEGTLVASYNRGIKLLNLCGGVKVSVVADAMQRAPVFVFEDARHGREFLKWINLPENMEKIREEAEATSSVAKLQYIDPYLSNKFVFLRFNYSTGDAAGQNMVGRATFAACSWILDHYQGITNFFLESNFATDKKASQVNIMRTRGKRVTAEAVVKRDVLIQHMRVEPEKLVYHGGIANIGAILSGANNNGLHSANAITAMFIATGQDVANVAESSAGVIYAELTPERDLYISITIPSLIVATYGGGTSLATQRECLELLGCVGKGKVNKFAEIVAGVVLAGELSLAAAISSSDWVSSHEKYGRNR